jgi:hypothetical protein
MEKENGINDIYKRAEQCRQIMEGCCEGEKAKSNGILWCLSVEMSVSRLHI